MILKSPLPFEWHTSTFEEIQKIDTAPEMPAINTRNKVVLREDWQPQPPPEEWAPPPYWKSLLHMDESRFEQECKKWFARAMVVVILVSIFILSCIFLLHLIMQVANLK